MKSHKLPPTDLDTLMPLLINIWRRYRKLTGPADVLQTREFRSVVEAVQKLQKGLETGSLTDKDYQDPDLLGAYLLYYWVIHYQQGLSLINEVPRTPRRVLDLCAGLSPFGFAALKHGAQEVISIDKSLPALKLGAEVCGRFGYPLTIRQNQVQDRLPIEGRFDLIILSHCLQELFPDTQKHWQDAQKQFIERIMRLLTPDGFILFVDSSLPHMNHRLLALRDQLVQEGIPVQAPCVWKGRCPALEANSFCYAQRELEKPYLIKEIQRAAQINLGSLKMTYLLMRNREAGWPEWLHEPLYRVISPPVDSHMGKRFYLCGTDGKKTLGSRLDPPPATARAFEYLKRGELITVQNAVEKSYHFDIVEETIVKVEAALNKPLPEEEDEKF